MNRYEVEVCIPVYVRVEVFAEDEWEARDIANENIEGIDYADNSVGFECCNERIIDITHAYVSEHESDISYVELLAKNDSEWEEENEEEYEEDEEDEED